MHRANGTYGQSPYAALRFDRLFKFDRGHETSRIFMGTVAGRFLNDREIRGKQDEESSASELYSQRFLLCAHREVLEHSRVIEIIAIRFPILR